MSITNTQGLILEVGNDLDFQGNDILNCQNAGTVEVAVLSASGEIIGSSLRSNLPNPARIDLTESQATLGIYSGTGGSSLYFYNSDSTLLGNYAHGTNGGLSIRTTGTGPISITSGNTNYLSINPSTDTTAIVGSLEVGSDLAVTGGVEIIGGVNVAAQNEVP